MISHEHAAILARTSGYAADTTRVIDDARALATAVSRLMARWAEASPDVRDHDLWAPMGRALNHIEDSLHILDSRSEDQS